MSERDPLLETAQQDLATPSAADEDGPGLRACSRGSSGAGVGVDSGSDPLIVRDFSFMTLSVNSRSLLTHPRSRNIPSIQSAIARATMAVIQRTCPKVNPTAT